MGVVCRALCRYLGLIMARKSDLTNEQRDEIKRLYPTHTDFELQNMFNCSQTIIRNIAWRAELKKVKTLTYDVAYHRNKALREKLGIDLGKVSRRMHKKLNETAWVKISTGNFIKIVGNTLIHKGL